MPSVVVTEFMDPEGLDAMRAHADVVYRPELGTARAELLEAVAGADALVVRNRTQVDAELLARAPRLRVIGRLGAGLDNIDVDAAHRLGIHVVFARGANAEAVCEYVFAALFHLLRHLHEASAAVHAGDWPREEFIGNELSGRTLGLLGFGEVGRRVARGGMAFGMHVIAYDPLLTPDDVRRAGLDVPLLPLGEVLSRTDVLSLHLPLLPETRHLIDAKALAGMRRGAILLNTSRGGVVDEQALADALVSGRMAGAVLDVREQEPPSQPDPLAPLPQVVLTPHLAGLTVQAQERVGASVARDVLAVLQGGQPLHQA